MIATQTDTPAEVLSRSWDDIPEPKVLPEGTWLLQGRNVVLMPKTEDISARVLFFYRAKEPMEDVSDAELEALGPDYDFNENDIVKQFWVDRNKDWDAVRKHFALHGIDTAGKTQQETFDAFKNSEVLAFLGTKTYTKNGQTVTDNDPSQFAAVE